VSRTRVVLVGTAVGSGVPTYAVLVAAGTLGSLLGGLLAYGIGALVTPQRAGVERARAWLERRGAVAVFVSRLTPVVRSVVSYPAGALRLPLGPYLVATLLAGLVWCLAFAGAGWALGGAWETFRHADYATVVAILAALALVTVHRFHQAHRAREAR
jgi:membrane protein DedA with SNARE-associated domain